MEHCRPVIVMWSRCRRGPGRHVRPVDHGGDVDGSGHVGRSPGDRQVVHAHKARQEAAEDQPEQHCSGASTRRVDDHHLGGYRACGGAGEARSE